MGATGGLQVAGSGRQDTLQRAGLDLQLRFGHGPCRSRGERRACDGSPAPGARGAGARGRACGQITRKPCDGGRRRRGRVAHAARAGRLVAFPRGALVAAGPLDGLADARHGARGGRGGLAPAGPAAGHSRACLSRLARGRHKPQPRQPLAAAGQSCRGQGLCPRRREVHRAGLLLRRPRRPRRRGGRLWRRRECRPWLQGLDRGDRLLSAAAESHGVGSGRAARHPGRRRPDAAHEVLPLQQHGPSRGAARLTVAVLPGRCAHRSGAEKWGLHYRLHRLLRRAAPDHRGRVLRPSSPAGDAAHSRWRHCFHTPAKVSAGVRGPGAAQGRAADRLRLRGAQARRRRLRPRPQRLLLRGGLRGHARFIAPGG
mmetsp:Transcript_56347/g.159938  ORF Transcript_56347/g.159938 Transcript_56347/m.159938 type:complete len:371 (-) Transcript_56347:94-1206(-)